MNKIRVAEGALLGHFSFHSRLDSFDVADYVLGTEERRWPGLPLDPPEIPIASATYETALAGLMHGGAGTYPVIAVKGGVGCGKTSALIYAFKHRELIACAKCSDETATAPIRIYIDFGELLSSAPLPPERELGEACARLEAKLASEIKPHLEDHGDGLLRFWRWCETTNEPAAAIEAFQNHITAYRGAIVSGDVDQLGRAFASLWLSLTSSDRILYRVAQRAFLEQPDRTLCNLVIIDNIDQLEPETQRELARLSRAMARILSCRVIVALRPFTWAARGWATHLDAYVTHRAPELVRLITARTAQFKQRQPESTHLHRALHSLLDRITEEPGKPSALAKLISWTCGHSARFVVQNVHNLLVHPSLDVDLEMSDPFRGISNSALYEAYLCNDQRLLDRQRFDNLFAVSHSVDPDQVLIKTCVLFVLLHSRDHRMQCAELCKYIVHMARFSPHLLAQALNDMMPKERPLIWSSHSHSMTVERVQHPDDTECIYLTTLGTAYYKYLISNPYYFRECIFDHQRGLDRGKKSTRVGWIADEASTFLATFLDTRTRVRRRVEQQCGQTAWRLLEQPPYSGERWVANMRDTLRRLRSVQGRAS